MTGDAVRGVHGLQRLLVLCLLVGATGGCAIGMDTVLFVTKTGIAVDADTEPPSLDVGYARKEVVIGPVFKEGKVLPVLTSIGADAGGFAFGVKQSFATGSAALIMAKELTSDTNPCAPGGTDELELCPRKPSDQTPRSGTIRTKPRDPTQSYLSWALFGDSERKRYFFGTDTNFGLHVQWAASEIPRSVMVGFKRKELAHVPLIEKSLGPPSNEVDITLASLIATGDARANIGTPAKTNVSVDQTFATGDAATLLAAHPGIREVLGRTLFVEYNQIRAYRVTAAEQEKEAKRILRCYAGVMVGDLPAVWEDANKWGLFKKEEGEAKDAFTMLKELHTEATAQGVDYAKRDETLRKAHKRYAGDIADVEGAKPARIKALEDHRKRVCELAQK